MDILSSCNFERGILFVIRQSLRHRGQVSLLREVLALNVKEQVTHVLREGSLSINVAVNMLVLTAHVLDHFCKKLDCVLFNKWFPFLSLSDDLKWSQLQNCTFVVKHAFSN